MNLQRDKNTGIGWAHERNGNMVATTDNLFLHCFPLRSYVIICHERPQSPSDTDHQLHATGRSFLYQYWYCADLICAFKRWDPTLACWLTLRRSLMNRQQRSMTCVPALTRVVLLLLGILCSTILTYRGVNHFHTPLHLTRFFWWITRSCSTPSTLTL